MARSAIRSSLFAAGLLFALLAVLATLQFRWIGEVRDAERERLQASARAAAEAVAIDFDREVGRAMRTFGEALRARGTGGLAASLAAARARWAADAKFPSLVSRADVVRREGGDWTVAEPDSSGRLAPTPWPAELAPAKKVLAISSDRPPADAPPGTGDRHGPPRMPFLRMLDDPPILILGVLESGEGLLVSLDRAAISDQILPQLVARHFGARGEYDVAVLGTGEPRPILYRSRPDFAPSRSRAPDAEVPLFGPRPASEPGALVRHEGASPDGPPPGAGPVPGGTPRAIWILVASHRAGSLDDVVDATRTRNLAVSGGILLLLAAAVGVLVTSAHRSARLARQQVEFVANLTHELRTPLAAIRSAGQNLSDGLIADASRVQKYGDLIQREGRRLSSLIESALAQAGIEARGESARAGSASLAEAVDQAIDACRHLADENRARVDANIPPGLPPVAGDEPAVRTLMENLLSNAIKYGGENGRVTVSAAADERGVRIAIRDRGPGIPEAELPRIFEPFYRGSRAYGNVGGTGIGLSLVRRIVDALGGQIDVESRPREGTTFTVTLPRATEPAGEAGPA
jgi:two-component system, OmpR family, sensor histidine kinase SenX3